VRPFLHVILLNPEIPPNTGNIARLCAATRSALHLIHPLGFRLDDRSLRRAGLDYWDHVDVHEHGSLSEALASTGGGPAFYYSARAPRPYDRAPYASGSRLVFGPESTGIAPGILRENSDACYGIPLWGGVRSLNLSTTVGIVVYEAYRQLGAWDSRDLRS
jgi:tRNA (cytidine/uridine-2'-O-)-methyltransferase